MMGLVAATRRVWAEGKGPQNGTSTTSPNSKGIAAVVFRVAPNRREGRDARRCCRARQRALLFARGYEIHEILDLDDPFRRQGANFLHQGLGVRDHVVPCRLASIGVAILPEQRLKRNRC